MASAAGDRDGRALSRTRAPCPETGESLSSAAYPLRYQRSRIVNRIARTLVVAGAFLCCAAPAWCDDRVALPDTPVGQRTKRLFEALESGNRDTIQAFIEEGFSPQFLGAIPLARHVDLNAKFAADTGGLVPRRIISASETRLR